MTTPPPPQTPEQERAINETICQFMGPNWTFHNAYYEIDKYVSDGKRRHALFTRSLDSLRLAEEKLTPEQWFYYAEALENAMDNDAMKEFAYDDFSLGVVWALKAPVSVRAAALAEVVQG